MDMRAGGIDWAGCSVVERVPGRCGGVPTLRSSRMPMYLFMDVYEDGLTAEEFAEDYEQNLDNVRAAYAYLDDYVKANAA